MPPVFFVVSLPSGVVLPSSFSLPSPPRSRRESRLTHGAARLFLPGLAQHFTVYYIAALKSHTALRARRSRISSIDVAFSEGGVSRLPTKKRRIKWTRERCALYHFIARSRRRKPPSLDEKESRIMRYAYLYGRFSSVYIPRRARISFELRIPVSFELAKRNYFVLTFNGWLRRF